MNTTTLTTSFHRRLVDRVGQLDGTERAAARKMLARHVHMSGPTSEWCYWCQTPENDDAWPCADLLSLGRLLGVEP